MPIALQIVAAIVAIYGVPILVIVQLVKADLKRQDKETP